MSCILFTAAYVDVSLRVIPGRDAVPPPQLPADAPVFDPVHPVEIGFAPVGGYEFDPAVLDGLDGRPGERGDFYVPLVGQIRLDNGLRAIPARDHQLVIFDFLQQILFFQVFHDSFARFEAIKAAIFLGSIFIQGCVGVEHIDQRQAMTFADLIVVEIMGGCYFHASGTKL